MRLLASILTALLPSLTFADTLVNCGYKYMGIETWRVQVLVYSDGEPASSVQVQVQGSSNKQPATPETRAADELVHLWISKNDPQNRIEMIVYRDIKSLGQSKLINENMPMVKELWGDCVFRLFSVDGGTQRFFGSEEMLR